MSKAQDAVRKANETLAMYLELKTNFERLPKVSDVGFVSELKQILEGSENEPAPLHLDVVDLSSLRKKFTEYASYNKARKHMTEAKRDWYNLSSLAREAIIDEYNELNINRPNAEQLKSLPSNNFDKMFVGSMDKMFVGSGEEGIVGRFKANLL